MTLRDVAGDAIRRQEPALAEQGIWAERAKMLRTDRLTGLSNRLGWAEAIDDAMYSTSGLGGPLVVARIDLDRPAAQDEPSPSIEPVLSFAGRARRVVPSRDLFARLDGNALVVALSLCPSPLAVGILERIRSSVPEGQTCSVGWAVWDRKESSEVLMSRAGQALELAVARGGDQIVAA